jgi:hypothetical protein
MFLNPGDTILVVHRWLFEGDGVRFFTFSEQDGHLALSASNGYTMNLAELTYGGH